MADKRIKGITVEIGGDTTKLQDALKDVNKALKTTQDDLRDVNKLLKMDPGNADLLAQKQKYLTEAIDETSQKLATEKEALEQLKSAPDTEKTRAQQEALTREIAATTQQLDALKKEYSDFGNVAGQQIQVAGASIKEAGEKIQDVGGAVSSVGGAITKGVTAPIVAVGAASVAAWKEVDEAMDTVTTKTGASGEALADMQDRAKSIAETVPTDFQTAAEAVGEVNTRFGLTGDELEALSTKFVKFSSLNGTDVSGAVDSVSAALSAFGQDASDAGNLLDALNAAGQATGVSVDTLAQDLTKNAAQFTAMGLSAEQAAGMIGAADMAGLDASVMLSGLTKAQKNASDQGLTLQDSLSAFSAVMNSNASDTEKLQAAYDTFGSKAGAAIENAVANGSLSLDELSGNLGDFAGSVESTFDETVGPLDSMTTTMNALKTTGAELVDTAGPMITEALGIARDAVNSLRESWDGLSPDMQEAIVKGALLAAAVGPIVAGVGGLITGVGKLVSFGGTLISGIGTIVAALGPVGLIIAGIAAGAALIITNWDSIGPFFANLWSSITDSLESAKTALSEKWDSISAKASEAWSTIQTATGTAWDAIQTSVAEHGGGIQGVIGAAVDGYIGIWQTGFDKLDELTGGKMTSIKDTISGAIDKIKGFFNFDWHLPDIKLPHFSISGGFSLVPPSVPHFSVDWYRKAYDNAVLFTSPTVIPTASGLKGFGDGAGGELVIGQNALMNAIRGATAGTGGITVNVYPSQGMDERAIADYAIDRLTQQLAIQNGRI